MRVTIRDEQLLIGAVYGPNTNEFAVYDFLQGILNRWRGTPVVLGGDWNATLSNLPLNPTFPNFKSTFLPQPLFLSLYLPLFLSLSVSLSLLLYVSFPPSSLSRTFTLCLSIYLCLTMSHNFCHTLFLYLSSALYLIVSQYLCHTFIISLSLSFSI